MRPLACLLALVACCSCSAPVGVNFQQGSDQHPDDPAICTPARNQRLLDLLNANQTEPVDNVMVCGTTISPSRTRSGGPHGSHQVLPLRVRFPDGTSKLVEVVTNDDLDGILSAPQGAAVSAYGQAFFDRTGHFAAGIHDVHCSTHRGADNGWVIINSQKFPDHC